MGFYFFSYGMKPSNLRPSFLVSGIVDAQKRREGEKLYKNKTKSRFDFCKFLLSFALTFPPVTDNVWKEKMRKMRGGEE